MDTLALRRKFLEYYQDLGYQVVSPSSLVPENDPSVLFTTAGMQQFKHFYQHPTDAPSPKLATVQPVIRTSDIAEVGDETHLTMFEMLGNFVFGQEKSMELKKRAITEAWNFVTKELKVSSERIHVTVFAGDAKTPADTESEGVWQTIGATIKKGDRADNFWGPTGEEGPCGPNTELYIDGVEVWNLVFNEYHQDQAGNFKKLDHFGLDTGSGLERLAATLQEQDSIWAIEPLSSWVKFLEAESQEEARIIVDHLRASIFIISSGLIPGNKGRDYVLRRLLRTMFFYARRTSHNTIRVEKLISQIVTHYASIGYGILSSPEVESIITTELHKYYNNLTKASNYLDRWLSWDQLKRGKIDTDTKLAFHLFESYGFPKEAVLRHLLILRLEPDRADFEKLFVQHQTVSRAGLEKQFKGGLADHNEQTIKHHTAHHLLLAALRQVLGPAVVQRGSNVTSERLRLDFSFDRKLTAEELKKVEEIVNQKIEEDLPVVMEQLPKEEALQSGALAEFGQKYGDVVTVYSIGDFSKELCGGPHVTKTGQLGRFEILKEEASSQGVRRIKARLI